MSTFDAFRRERVHRSVDRLMDDADLLASDPSKADSSGISPRTLLLHAMTVAASAVGLDALRAGYGPSSFEGAASRLAYLEWLFSGVEIAGQPYSTGDLIEEIESIAAADAPILLAQRTSLRRPTKRHRLAKHRLKALFWDAHLREIGIPAAARQGRIQMAFGVTWDAVVKWRSVVEDELGTEHVNMMLDLAKVSGRLSDQVGEEDWLASLQRAGEAYQNAARL